MTEEEIRELIRSDESYRIELTVSTTDKDKFQEAICAFSNDMPGYRKKGYLLIRVKNNGELSGLKVDDELLKSISALRSTGNILPLPVMHCEKVEMKGGDVLVVEVTPSFNTPVRYRGRTFIRIGPRRDVASLEEERILTERCTDSLATFDVSPCREATIQDIDTDYISSQYLPAAINPEELLLDKRPLKEQMASLRLYNMRYDCPTMAAVILFGKNPRYFLPGAYVQFVRFQGKDKSTKVINEREFKGGLYELLPRLESFTGDAVVNQRPVPVSLFREKTVTNYPQAALRELLMNACMHRDYQSNTPIRFYQFEDRIELMNPGGLYGEARPENFPFVNAYRNPVVAEAMKNMKYVNMFNRGVGSVQESLKQNGSEKAHFLVDKLTVFEVNIEDANITDLRRYGNVPYHREEIDKEQFSTELTTHLPVDTSQIDDRIKLLILIINRKIMPKKDMQNLTELTTNLQPTYNLQEWEADIRKLCSISWQSFMKSVLNPAIEQGWVTREYPEALHHPRQRYLLTDKGMQVLEAIIKEGKGNGYE